MFSYAGVATQVMIHSDEVLLLVDCGDGTLRDLLMLEIDPTLVDAIFITHGHFDHMGGLYPLLGFMRMIGREDSLGMYAPAGCAEVTKTIEAFRAVYLDTLPFELEFAELQPKQTISIENISIEAHPVTHHGGTNADGILDQIPACGYRIHSEGETIAVTGDTGDCPEVRELVRDADLALIEATYRSDEDTDEESVAKVHLTKDIAEEIGRSAKNHLLIHRNW